MKEVQKLKTSSTIDMKVYIELSEIEARALHTLTLWGDDVFLRVFEEKLGGDLKRKKYEDGIKSLFEYVRKTLPTHLAKVDAARESFNAIKDPSL